MIVTGPTVIAPLLRQARLRRRPAALLQWEAIVNDPVGALAAVLAFEIVLVRETSAGPTGAVFDLVLGIGIATALGLVAGWGLARAFARGLVPEYMKVPVLFASVLAVFAVSDHVLHESGLLAVTLMGLWIANVELPSYVELRRFKEQATVLLVSGVFILLAASMSRETLFSLDLRAAAFVAVVILLARPVAVLLSLIGSNVPWAERTLIALTGPRGVVLVAVAGLFGERLAEIGIDDGARMAPLAFALVGATVVLHGFALGPLARLLGLSAADRPGVLIVGGAPWSVALAKALTKLDLPVMIADPNLAHLRGARDARLETFFGDVLAEEAEHRLDLVRYETVIAATDNDAYNTLVTTDLGPEFGREKVFQLRRVRTRSRRHALPATLGGRPIGADETFAEANARIQDGWEFRVTTLTEEFTLKQWRETLPAAIAVAELKSGMLTFFGSNDTGPTGGAGSRIVSLAPKRQERKAAATERAARSIDPGQGRG